MSTASTPDPGLDPWCDWLLRQRHGGDEHYRMELQQELNAIRNRVLDAAHLVPAMTMIDIGTGDGLIALGAFERMGPSLRMILSDTSASLLSHVEQRTRLLCVADCCTFLQSSAEHLNGIGDCTADVITMRAVLAYRPDKEAVAAEMYRLLKPGGRMSSGEPIFRENASQCEEITHRLERHPHDANYRMAILHQKWRAAQFPSTIEERMRNPLTNFSERDLAIIFQKAGFQDIHLEFHVDVRRSARMRWETFLGRSPRPQIPALRDIMDREFTLADRVLCEENMRPKVEAGGLPEFTAIAYLSAVKPL